MLRKRIGFPTQAAASSHAVRPVHSGGLDFAPANSRRTPLELRARASLRVSLALRAVLTAHVARLSGPCGAVGGRHARRLLGRDGLPQSIFSRIMAVLETLGAAAFVAVDCERARGQGAGQPGRRRRRHAADPRRVRRDRAPGYIVVDGQRYDRSLVELARELKRRRGAAWARRSGELLADARDGPGVTETERETLRWVCASFGMTRAARVSAGAVLRARGVGVSDACVLVMC